MQLLSEASSSFLLWPRVVMCDLSGLIKEVCFPPLLKLLLVGYIFVYSFPQWFSRLLWTLYIFLIQKYILVTWSPSIIVYKRMC